MKEKMKLLSGRPFLLLVSLLLAGLYAYCAVLFYNEYSWWNSILSVVFSTLLLWFCVIAACFLLNKARKNKGKTKIIVSTAAVLLLYNLILWCPALFMDFILGFSKSDSAAFGVILASVLYAASLVFSVCGIFNKHLLQKALCGAFAVLFVLTSGVSFLYLSSRSGYFNKKSLQRASEMEISFDKITFEQLAVTSDEKKRCSDWFNTNILNAGKERIAPAYDFSVNGISLRNTYEDWNFSVGETSAAGVYHTGGKTTFITLTNDTLRLKATVEATLFEAFAVCEWTVYITNTSDENSGEITNFYALNHTFDLGEDAHIYYSAGSDSSKDDFTLKKVKLADVEIARFTGTGGRSSVEYMPYFNMCGSTNFVMSVGWTGQWEASCRLFEDSVFTKVRQENLSAYLTPGEEIRSPLVSLCFYDGANALKGFNSLRKWEMTLAPDVCVPQVFYCYANEQDYFTSTDNIEEMLKLADFDALWIDAAWYKLHHGQWYNSVGSWSADCADKKVFPDGIKSVGKFAAEKGLDLLLWYEPERVTKGSELYKVGKQNDGWLLSGGDFLWNLADEDAFRYLCAYISTSIKDIGISVYRQDFNTQALYYWNWGDKHLYGGRTGITENHYVTNLYAYWDYLLQTNYGLLIDNCASGGRRLDAETARRCVFLHRSDYIKDNESTQSMTYGASLWVPANGTVLEIGGEYKARSWMTALNNVVIYNEENVEIYKDLRRLHNSVYKHWFENYFPLTSQNRDCDKWLAMQYGGGDSGFAVVYKRENVKENTFALIMNGLSENKKYVLTDYDKPEKPLGTFTGKQLMSEGVILNVEETPKATVVLYKIK